MRLGPRQSVVFGGNPIGSAVDGTGDGGRIAVQLMMMLMLVMMLVAAVEDRELRVEERGDVLEVVEEEFDLGLDDVRRSVELVRRR